MTLLLLSFCSCFNENLFLCYLQISNSSMLQSNYTTELFVYILYLPGGSRDGLSLLHGVGDLSWEDLNGWVLELSKGFFITSLAPELKVGLSWAVSRSAYLIFFSMAWALSQHGGLRAVTHFLHRRSGLQDLVSQETRQKLPAFPALEAIA